MPRGHKPRVRYTVFRRQHAYYVYRGGRFIEVYTSLWLSGRRIFNDDFPLMTLETMMMWLDEWEVNNRVEDHAQANTHVLVQ